MDNSQSTPTNFVATVYGDLVPLNNSALSKARLKIFYKGLNRNGSYITDEIGEQLISTLPGTPVVGYFDGDKDDFLGHVDKEMNRAYGFVPETMNFKWEMSLDPDGIYRTYACTDVILWTGRYPIASKIVGKSHSMELNPNTIEGQWVEHDDEICFEFTHAEFIGLCVLGEEYEPCFEGSSFYELHKDKKAESEIKADLKAMYALYSQVNNVADENLTGGLEMEEENKEILEPTPTPEEEVVEENVVEEEVPSNEEQESQEQEVPTSEEEEKPEEEQEETPNNEEEGEEESSEEEEQEEEEEEETENSEEKFEAIIAEKDSEIAQLKAELESLQSYKAQKINEEKENVLNSYSNKLSEEEVNTFKAKLDSYNSAVELKKDIALCILDKEMAEEEEDTDATQYSLVNNQKTRFTGAASIVAQYVKNN